jgi:Flp pilus assembly protein TadD
VALVLGLSACAGNPASGPGADRVAQKNAMLLQIADETDAGGDPATAASLYRQLHETAPSDPVPLARLGASLLRTGDYRPAAEAYGAALALDPGNQDLHRGRALALLLANDSDAALAEIRAALARRADDPRLYALLGVAQDMTGHHDLAQQTYRHGLQLAPANLGLRNNLAMSLALGGDYAEAVTELRGIAGAGASPRYLLNLALAYGLAGEDAQAAATAREVLDEPSVQSNLANYALLRSMSEAQRTAAILGSELHGTALAFVPAKAAPVEATAASLAADAPQAAPAPAPVAVASMPPPIQTLSVASPTPTPPAMDAPAVPAAPVVAHTPSGPDPAPSSPVSSGSDAAQTPSPQSRAKATNDDLSRQTVGEDPLAQNAAASPAREAETFLSSRLLWPVALHSDFSAPAAAPAVEPAAAPPGPPSVAAPAAAPPGPPSVAAPAAAEISPAPEASVAEITVTASRLPDRGAYAVQLGSFLLEAGARRLTDEFAANGVTMTLTPLVDDAGRHWFVVRAGDFNSAGEAHDMLRMIQSMGAAQAIVVRQRETTNSTA